MSVSAGGLPPQTIQDVQQTLIGLSSRIQTPFGELCSLACDLSTNGRTVRHIEECVLRARSQLSSQLSSTSSSFSASLQTFSCSSILSYFGLSQASHQIEETRGDSETSPYIFLSKTLKSPPPQSSDGSTSPIVYITSSESYFNVRSWEQEGLPLDTFDVNNRSEILTSSITDRLTKNALTSNTHLISISASSNITGQRVPNLEAVLDTINALRTSLTALNKAIKILISLNVTSLVQKESLVKKFPSVDFFIIQSKKLLGCGVDSPSLVISKKETLQRLTFSSQIVYTNMTSSPVKQPLNNPIGLYRIALSLTMCDMVGLTKIAASEAANVKAFLEEISTANRQWRKVSNSRSINVWGDSSEQPEMKFGNLFLNVYAPGADRIDSQTRTYLHPALVASLLRDLFGVQSEFKANISYSPTDESQETARNGSTRKQRRRRVLLNIPHSILHEVFKAEADRQQSEELVGCLQLDLSFVHTLEEVTYVAKALTLIAEQGQELQKFYDRERFFQLKHTTLVQEYDYSTTPVANLTSSATISGKKRNSQPAAVALNPELEFYKSRVVRFAAQTQLASAVFNDPKMFLRQPEKQHKQQPQLSTPIKPTATPQKTPPNQNDSPLKQPTAQQVSINQQKTVMTTTMMPTEANILAVQREQPNHQSEEVQNEVALLQEEEEDEVEQLTTEEAVPIAEVSSEKEEIIQNAVIAAVGSLREQKSVQKADPPSPPPPAATESEEKLPKALVYKEQFVFEDLKPSVMFKNVLDHRQKREKHLRLIFTHYSKSGIIPLPPPETQKAALRKGDPRSNPSNPPTLSLHQFLLFCSEFSLITQSLDTTMLSEIYLRAVNVNRGEPSSSTTSIASTEMNFNQFFASIEKISLVFYYDNHLLITSFDKMEALYQSMQIDNLPAIKKRMKKPSPFAAADLNSILFRSSPAEKQSEYMSPTFAQPRHSSGVFDAHPPASFSKLKQSSFDSIFEGNSQLKKAAAAANPTVMKASAAVDVFSNLFKHENNSLLHANDFAEQSKNQLITPSLKSISSQRLVVSQLPQPSHKNLNVDIHSRSPAFSSNSSNIFSNINSSKPLDAATAVAISRPFDVRSSNNNIGGGARSSIDSRLSKPNERIVLSGQSALARVKKIEDIEAQRQQDLLMFIQQNQQNRYNQQKKKL